MIVFYILLIIVTVFIRFYLGRKEKFADVSNNSDVAVVCVLHPGAGFFSEFFFLCKVYLFAKERGSPFFIEHDNWQYTFEKGWHDYFTSLNDFKDEGQFKEIKRYRPHFGDDIPEYTIKQYVDCIKEIFILNDTINSRVEEFIGKIGGEYTSLYVRRGDKVNEMPLISIDDILKQTDIQDDGRNIFLQSDDSSVIGDIKTRFPSCNVLTLTPDNKSGANNADMTRWKPEQRKHETEELLISCAVFVRAQKGWSYYHSNVGTFHKLFGYNTIQLYIDNTHTKEEVDNVYNLNYKGSPYALI